MFLLSAILCFITVKAPRLLIKYERLYLQPYRYYSYFRPWFGCDRLYIKPKGQISMYDTLFLILKKF